MAELAVRLNRGTPGAARSDKEHLIAVGVRD